MRKYLGLLLLLLATSAYTADYHISKAMISTTTVTQPAKGSFTGEATFYLSLYRVTASSAEAGGDAMVAPAYSRWPIINSSQEYLYLQRTVGGEDAMLYSATDYSLIKIFPTTVTWDGTPGVSFSGHEAKEFRWDYTGDRPDTMYSVQGSSFVEYNVLLDTVTTIRCFSSHVTSPTAKIHNDVEGDSSADSRYWAFMLKGPYDGEFNPLWALVTYDKLTDTVLGTMDHAAYVAAGGTESTLPTPNMVEISPLGTKVIYHLGASGGGRPGDADGYFDGAWAWDLDFTNPIKVSVSETHSGWGFDSEGAELFVSQNNQTDWLEARYIVDGSSFNILNHGDLGWGNGMHFARMPSTTPGWSLISTYKSGENDDWGDNQLFMLELVATGSGPRVWRLAHTYNNFDEYYAEAFAPMSQHGDKVWWGAKWPGTDSIETYEITLPDGWVEELGGAPANGIWDGGGGDNNWSTAANWTNDVSPGTAHNIIFNDRSNKACTIDVSTTVAKFNINSGSTITITASNDLTVTGDVTISTGTFTAGGITFSVGGDWTLENVAVFTAGTSTVTFTGAVEHELTGDTTFYGLHSIISGATLQFEANTTFYATNMMDFEDGYLRSSSDGSPWHFKYSGSSMTVSGITVQDSNASTGTEITATDNCTDDGNNTNWDFGAAPAASTPVYYLLQRQ